MIVEPAFQDSNEDLEAKNDEVSWNVRGLNDPGKRLKIKNMVHKWRADVYCFQESKLRGDIRETI
ncbi:hypothetical protein H5410_015234 [Solanum commersonii]|uniref:Uncharacterized protein n=1 Tax=Solanum commersonii TaxID=4109 RepID=A0A9J5ZTT0_SOLCO|nr:hypothetical protein H5410_015234 [Solanum commersonii]